LSVPSAATVGNASDGASQFAVSLATGFTIASWTNTAATFGGIAATGAGSGAIGIAFDATNGGYISCVAPGIGYYNLKFNAQTHSFLTTGARQFYVSNTNSAVNYVQATGAVTTGAPELSAQGSDTNINLKLTPKGTGGVQFTGPLLPNNLAGTSGQVLTSAGAGAVPTWTSASAATITDDTTTNAVRYVSFTAASSGSLSTLYTSSTKLKYNPSTGALTASSIIIAP